MKDEVEKLKVQIYNSLPTCQGEDSIYCTSRTPNPVCKKAIDEILALIQKAQVEAVRAARIDALKFATGIVDDPVGVKTIQNEIAKLNARTSLTKEDGEPE